MSDENKNRVQLQAHQIEELYSEQDASAFGPIPMGLKIGIYGLVVLIVLFLASAFVIRIEVAREFPVYLLAINDAKEIELRIIGQTQPLVSDVRTAVIKLQNGRDIPVRIRDDLDEKNSDDSVIVGELLADRSSEDSPYFPSSNTFQRLLVTMKKKSLFDVLFMSGL